MNQTCNLNKYVIFWIGLSNMDHIPVLHTVLPEYGLYTSTTVFVPLATQGGYQSHFRWALIKTLIYWFFSLELVIFEKNINGK